MMQAVSTAAAGMKAQQTRLETVSSNVSNVNTTGYKSSRVDFKDALYTSMRTPMGDAMGSNLLKGSGTVINAIGQDFTDGARVATDGALDFAIVGDGFFSLENSAGDTVYTRNGNFTVSEEDGSNYLVNAQGYYVLDDGGERIELPAGAKVSLSSGAVLSSEDDELATLGITDFENKEGLSAVGGSCYQTTAASGEGYTAEDPQLQQGYLENANVDLASELTLLMRAQRAYAMASKALQTADDMDGLANNIR